MADTQVTADATSAAEQEDACWIYTYGDNRVAFGVSGGKDLVAIYNEAAGAPNTVSTLEANTVVSMACWFDRETPGDTGTLVHIVLINHGAASTGTFDYVTFDMSDPSGTGFSAITEIVGSLATSATGNAHKTYITKANDGTLNYGYEITDLSNASYKGSPSAPTSIADPFEGNGGDDFVLGFPASGTGDDADVGVIFADTSANAYSVKMYDDSADTWTETAIATVTQVSNTYKGMDLAVRHSDGHVILTYWEDALNAGSGDDLVSYEITPDSIAAPTVTAKATVHTTAASGEANGLVGVMINQQNSDVYVAYARSATSILTDAIIYYRLSTDDLTSFGSEQSYQEDAGSNQRVLHAGRTVGTAGGAFMPLFHDDGTTDYWVNLTNDVVIAAANTRRYSLTTLGVG